jgi:hypothetical protein
MPDSTEFVQRQILRRFYGSIDFGDCSNFYGRIRMVGKPSNIISRSVARTTLGSRSTFTTKQSVKNNDIKDHIKHDCKEKHKTINNKLKIRRNEFNRKNNVIRRPKKIRY